MISSVPSSSSISYKQRPSRPLKELEIKDPPLAEQQRIVGLLDEAFEVLATAKANAEKNLQNARALFESHLQSVFTDQWKIGELVKLADGKARTIQHMTMTSFWHPDGTPMSAQQFMEILFGQLPDFFKDEEELRTLWSSPSTRATLLEGLAEAGFGYEQMTEMQKIIEAEKSDLFNVLAYVAYAMPPLTREERASKAKLEISSQFNPKQQAFLDFVLSHYVNVGVEELDPKKLPPLLKLKYHDSLPDAVAELGAPKQIQEVFVGFQKFLYVLAA